MKRAARLVLGAAFIVAIGPGMLAQGIFEQREHQWLLNHGVVGTATVVDASYGARGPDWVDVELTTAAGETIVARVQPADEDTDHTVGAKVQVLYDPADPYVIADVHDGNAARHRWLGIVYGAGVVLTTIAVCIGRLRKVRRRRSPDHVLDRVVQLRVGGATLAEITAGLNEEGLPTPGGGPRWSRRHVSRLLHTKDAQRRLAQVRASSGGRRGASLTSPSPR